MHRFDHSCHWCGVLAVPAWRQPRVVATAAALLFTVTALGGAWRAGIDPDALFERRERAVETEPVVVIAAAPTVKAPGALPDIEEGLTSTLHASTVAPPNPDSVHWTPAVARTWVNVREDASRGGEVVGIIKPDSRALLGSTERAGWRQVRSAEGAGWVDPKLFVAETLLTRNE